LSPIHLSHGCNCCKRGPNSNIFESFTLGIPPLQWMKYPTLGRTATLNKKIRLEYAYSLISSKKNKLLPSCFKDGICAFPLQSSPLAFLLQVLCTGYSVTSTTKVPFLNSPFGISTSSRFSKWTCRVVICCNKRLLSSLFFFSNQMKSYFVEEVEKMIQKEVDPIWAIVFGLVPSNVELFLRWIFSQVIAKHH
jgi:hypothetical protein